MSAPSTADAERRSRVDLDRQLLLRLAAAPASGDALAAAHGLTRAAVWKRIQALREAGIAIEARPGQGYRLAQPLDLLDAETLHAALAPACRARLAGLALVWQVDSTNSALLAQPPPAGGVRVLLAERQSGGRGRRGRAWVSPLAANLYLSLDRRFASGLARLPGLSLVAGIVAAEALRAVTGLDIRLKWPNDLLLDGRKLGGLLVEGGGEHAGPARAVIGLGVNVRMPPAASVDIGQPWADLTGAPRASSRNQLAAALLDALLPALDEFDQVGLARFLPRWQALDALAGRSVRIRLAEGELEAEALGIAADGALRVRTAQGERLLHAGEVSVRANV
ncbi:biotin--[acetyl-CoA-carboxylase] ligase [Lysobacter pythonis]|uniref:Bifunctional ligase/repressor BirA n=1 Tax=Solilutibacter pythonis TaxID=2483112 RepID=A0A3M2HUK1_9GAMM|nr:biotin--[acetyl-CoA-carboxylase] ligase [Lysobacter pythonis]RMH93391.1 biotin--[acetyl-CoA-carboxylase] ligase [Lysobacter pythonis]